MADLLLQYQISDSDLAPAVELLSRYFKKGSAFLGIRAGYLYKTDPNFAKDVEDIIGNIMKANTNIPTDQYRAVGFAIGYKAVDLFNAN